MKQFRFPVTIFAAALFCWGGASAQSGFPFQNESLRYNINYPSGLTLGEATMTASKGPAGWNFEVSVDAGVPGFAIRDKYRSSTEDDLCSTRLERDTSHGKKQVREKSDFDQKKGTARRTTTFPENGGFTDFDIPACGKDALAFAYLARREMGQGRVAPAQKVFFGSAYNIRMEYTGAVNVGQAVTDRVVVTGKGPKSDFTFEIFFARDAARTPLQIKIPVAIGTLSLELVR